MTNYDVRITYKTKPLLNTYLFVTPEESTTIATIYFGTKKPPDFISKNPFYKKTIAS
ncbi:hypothetical protein [Flavobacterium sp. SM2513]|uniref:hypothetical protein n=1 Tax=Flavobacterium sp. SM2513 TaxID=3424766 RepID=UPI003D7F19F4